MGGNAPVVELINLSEEYNGYCYIDDAHGTSIIGKNGGGFVLNELDNNFNQRLLLVSSLSKAFGATGGLGKAMLRLAISSLHTEKQILGLINYINKFYNAQ